MKFLVRPTQNLVQTCPCQNETYVCSCVTDCPANCNPVE